MYQIDFFSFDHNFCESQIYSLTQHPEYLNSISSLFITFIGINGLIKPHTDFFLDFLFSSLAINGVTSALYHWFNNIGFGLLDRMSMILIAISSTFLFMNHIHKFIKFDKWNNINLITKITRIIVPSYFTVLFTIAGLHMEDLFNILFGLFLASLILFMILVQRHQKNFRIPESIIEYGWKGIKYIALSGLFWIITENLCNHLVFVKYLFGHVVWHVFVSYGGYLISLIPNYISLIDYYDMIYIKHDLFGLPYLETA